mgnify:CR=1 FL=1
MEQEAYELGHRGRRTDRGTSEREEEEEEEEEEPLPPFRNEGAVSAPEEEEDAPPGRQCRDRPLDRWTLSPCR